MLDIIKGHCIQSLKTQKQREKIGTLLIRLDVRVPYFIST